MSKRGNKRDEDETLSQNEEPPRKNPKTAAAGSVSDDSDQIHICDLSNNRKVSVRNWQGKIVVDIREFYVKDGKEFPGKKGHAQLLILQAFHWALTSGISLEIIWMKLTMKLEGKHEVLFLCCDFWKELYLS